MKICKKGITILTILCFTSPLFSQWMVQHSGLPASLNPTLIFSAVDSNICWGIQDGFQTPNIENPQGILTTDGGINWNLFQLPVTPELKVMSVFGLNKDTAWITVNDTDGATGGGVFKTMNGGNDWIKQGTAFPGAGGHPSRVYFFDAGSGLCTGQIRNGYWEIYTTSDGGTNWTRVPSANIPAPASGDLAGTGAGAGNCFWFNSGSCSVYRTTDKGLTWQVTPNIFPTPAYFIELAFKDSLNGMALSYFGDEINKVAKSNDGGITWTSLPAPSSPPATFFNTYVPGTSGSYFVTSHNNIGHIEPAIPGSIYTPDGGLTWIHVDNLAHGPATFISSRIGWSGGGGDTIFKWNGNSLGVDDYAQNHFSNNITLSQNYPNPFTSSTSIEFRIPKSAKVILKVYDLLGSEVATLVNGERSAGSYTVNFEPRGLRPGIYCYSLRLGESVQTKKLCLL